MTGSRRVGLRMCLLAAMLVVLGGSGVDERVAETGAQKALAKVRGKAAREGLPTNGDEAAERFRRERVPAGEKEIPAGLYDLARERMRGMPRYSTVTGELVSYEPEAREKAALAWTELGPGNIGGRTRALVIDSKDPRIFYAAGASGGVWKSTDSGGNWRWIADDFANLTVVSLAMDPADSRVLYAGTGEGIINSAPKGMGIYRTADGGETWQHLAATSTADFHYVNDLVISTKDPSRIYAATRTGVWRSLDAGATWTHIVEPNVTGGCLDLAWRGDTSGDYLFASCGTFERATVWRAKNAQTNAAWEAVLSEPLMGRTSLAIAPSDPSVIYALAASNEPGLNNQALLGVFRSSSNGDAGSWTARTTRQSGHVPAQMLSNLITASGSTCSGLVDQVVTMGWYCNTIAVDPVDANRVWAGGVDLFRSDDGGQTWGIASYWWATSGNQYPAFLHADQHAIVFDPHYDGSTVRRAFFTNDGGVYRTDDTLAETGREARSPCDASHSKMRFTDLNNNYGVTQFYHGAVSPDGTQIIAGAQDNGTLMAQIDQGTERWRMVVGGDGGYVAFDPTEPKLIYAETQVGGMRRSPNGGLSFPSIRRGLEDEEFLFITPFTIDPNFTRRLWLGGRSMMVTTNRGDQWSRGSAPMPALVSAIAVQPGNSDRVLAGLANGQIAIADQATTSTPTTTWTLVQPRAGFVSSLAFDPKDANLVYATYAGFGGQHVWKSADAGATWTSIDGNLPDMPVHSIAIDPTRAGRLYLGTDLGVFVTLDGGQSWRVENTGFANAVTEAVVIAQGVNGPAIYAFTHGRGAWRAELVTYGPRRRGVRR
jgi:photosystem II stability/assembly factor-like uncharacterized protein